MNREVISRLVLNSGNNVRAKFRICVLAHPLSLVPYKSVPREKVKLLNRSN